MLYIMTQILAKSFFFWQNLLETLSYFNIWTLDLTNRDAFYWIFCEKNKNKLFCGQKSTNSFATEDN